MVGYTVNTGSSEEFAEGWDRVFGKAKRAAKKPARIAKVSETTGPAKSPKSTGAKRSKGKK